MEHSRRISLHLSCTDEILAFPRHICSAEFCDWSILRASQGVERLLCPMGSLTCYVEARLAFSYKDSH